MEEGKAVEDVVSLTISMADGTLCTVVSDFVGGETADRFSVSGTDGHITAEVLDDGAFSYETVNESGRLEFDVPDAPHTGLISHVEAVLLDDASNRTTGRDGLQTVGVLDECVRRCVRGDHPYGPVGRRSGRPRLTSSEFGVTGR